MNDKISRKEGEEEVFLVSRLFELVAQTKQEDEEIALSLLGPFFESQN